MSFRRTLKNQRKSYLTRSQAIKLRRNFYNTRRRAEQESGNGTGGHIYIADLGDGIYKIGKTIDIVKRSKTLSASNPRLRIIYNRYVVDRHIAEKAVLSYFYKNLITREVYRLSRGDIDKAKEIIETATPEYLASHN